jgi:FkbM family methyltransferase
MLTRESYIKSPIPIKNDLLKFFKKNDQLIIFDIGACESEDAIRYAMLFANSRIFAFEPREDNVEKSKELIKNYKKKNIILEHLALSNEEGLADFFLSEGEPPEQKNNESWDYGNKSSSLLPPSEEIDKHTAWLQFKRKTQVKTMRLDNYVKKNSLNIIDFVHLDVQGAELMVLEGAGTFLSKIKLIWMEVEAVELYQGQPLKNNVEQFMIKNNFSILQDTVNSVAGDQLYVNRSFFSDAFIKNVRAEVGLKDQLSGYTSRTKNFLRRFFK